MADTVCLIYLQYSPDQCRYSKQRMEGGCENTKCCYFNQLYFHDNFTAVCWYDSLI